jgi:hypothetical protein
MTRRAITSRQVLPAACCALALWLAAPAPALAQAAPTGADTAAVPAGLPLAEQARTAASLSPSSMSAKAR